MEEQYDKYFRKLPEGKKPHELPEPEQPVLEGSVDEIEVLSSKLFDIEE
jgi:hypothetical protein